MRTVRLLVVLLILLCLVPPLTLVMAGVVARQAGCQLDPDAPVPCQILGGDYGDPIYTLTRFGWYTVETLPILVALLISWLLIEVVRSIMSPRKQFPSQTPANSRNRVRGS
ncbi:MAG: hypothetical protein WBX25_31235 [Rhodomicrobium sp.]